jgi:DNA-binding transcriptional ArsR family regulator
LGNAGKPLSVNELVTKAIELGILESEPLQKGDRVPTRINHHIISLRELEIVKHEQRGGHVYYSLNPSGRRIFTSVKKKYIGEGHIELDSSLRKEWRSVIVKSQYVCSSWLKYFMKREDFSLEELLSDGAPITIIRVSQDERGESHINESFKDSGYRIISQNWGEHVLDEVERREVLQGLRRWTNEVYLTDESVPFAEAAPFAHLLKDSNGDSFEIESFIVTAWLDPDQDLPKFEKLINQILDNRRQGNRITIPELVIILSHEHGYAKENVKEMLSTLFYMRRDNYFFERGSKFLIDDAFRLTNKDKPSVYYLKLEGTWRTSLLRYGVNKKEAKK